MTGHTRRVGKSLRLGVLVLNVSLDVLYANHAGQELCRELVESRESDGFAPFDTDPGRWPLPNDLSRLLADIGRGPARHADANAWGQVYLRRTWDHRGRPLVLQVFGIPNTGSMQPSLILILLEEHTLRVRGTADEIADAKHRFRFTDRELAVAERLAGGLPNKEIATMLGITEQTIKVHVKHIMEKTEATTRTAVLAQLFRAPMQPSKRPPRFPERAGAQIDRPSIGWSVV
jgi:DNA-binding CsgD family transcriptional regulator